MGIKCNDHRKIFEYANLTSRLKSASRQIEQLKFTLETPESKLLEQSERSKQRQKHRDLYKKFKKLENLYNQWKNDNKHRTEFKDGAEARKYGSAVNHDTTAILRDTLKIGIETNDVASDALAVLTANNEKLQKMPDDLHETSNVLKNINKIIDRMTCRQCCGDCCVYVFSLYALVIFIAWLILKNCWADTAFGWRNDLCDHD